MTLISPNDEDRKTIFPGFHARVIHTDKSTIAFVDIDEGAVLPDHSHFNEQTLNVLEGELELKVDGKTLSVKQGESLILAPDVVHGGVAKTACKVIDVFVPRRDDWIDDQRSN